MEFYSMCNLSTWSGWFSDLNRVDTKVIVKVWSKDLIQWLSATGEEKNISMGEACFYTIVANFLPVWALSVAEAFYQLPNGLQIYMFMTQLLPNFSLHPCVDRGCWFRLVESYLCLVPRCKTDLWSFQHSLSHHIFLPFGSSYFDAG